MTNQIQKDARTLINNMVSQLAELHVAMRVRIHNVEELLLDAGIHSTYVQVLLSLIIIISLSSFLKRVTGPAGGD